MALFHSDPVLAGAYKGKALEERSLLVHVVCEEDFVFGRLKRKAGQALCDKKLDVCGAWESVDKADCHKCLEIYERIARETGIGIRGKV